MMRVSQRGGGPCAPSLHSLKILAGWLMVRGSLLPGAANKERAPRPGRPKWFTNDGPIGDRSAHTITERLPSVLRPLGGVQKNDRVRAKTGSGFIDYVAE
jgi:hypothetical protein